MQETRMIPDPPILPVDDSHDVLVVIPTVATPKTLVPSFKRLIEHLDGLRVHIVLSVNPLDPEAGRESVAECSRLWNAQKRDSTLTIYTHPGPAGFGGAINLGIRAALCDPELSPRCVQFGSPPYPLGIPPLTIIFNDDLHVTDGWLLGLIAGLESETIEIWSEPAGETGQRPKRLVSDYGTIGMIGPVSNLAAGIQQIDEEEKAAFDQMGLDDFARQWTDLHRGRIMTANFLSGFCTGYTRDFLNAVSVFDDEGRFSWLFDERYLIAGYEDNDLCARGDRAGFRAAVAIDTFVGHLGHQTFDAFFPESLRGMRNRGIYYDVWREHRKDEGKKLFGVMRVKMDVPHDLSMMRMALIAASHIVDGFAILLTGNPADALTSGELEQSKKEGIVHQLDLDLMKACKRAPDKMHKEFKKWAEKWVEVHPQSRKPEVFVYSWDGEFNERDERNRVIEIAEERGADWLLSIDHDEQIENRVTRAHFNRLMSHPDPLVTSYDLAFLTHWDGNRLVNNSYPWGDRGTYTGGMHGFRMWKVNKAAPRRIQAGGSNGLHCGNSPDFDGICKRVAGIRFRHFGYRRPQDRWRKEARYNVQDPTPNPLLVGGTSYGHIHHEENMSMSVYSPDNGIGLHMLVYGKESPEDVGRLLDQLYPLVDRIVLVWTGEWDLDDSKAWQLDPKIQTGRPNEDMLWGGFPDHDAFWPKTGPSLEMARMAEHFGCEWLHVPLNDNMGAARNAGLNALRGTPGMGWALFMDPDEHFQSPYQTAVSLRRMAECSDAWGWLVRFVNVYENGQHNESEAIRMGRLDADGRMYISGRVHEGYGAAVQALEAAGVKNFLRSAPFHLINTGLSSDPAKMDAKLAHYKRLTELEIQDNPHNSQAWMTLGLFWLNEGCPQTAMACS